MNTFRKNDPDSITAARKLADEVFGDKWEECGAAIYEQGPEEVQVWGIGHCHIDTAWWEDPLPRLRCTLLTEAQALAVPRHTAKGRTLLVDTG